jgi:hypothetical protein
MIGVIARPDQKSFVEEFFELFKTPWEMYVPGKQYHTVIMTDDFQTYPDSKLLICADPKENILDRKFRIELNRSGDGGILEENGLRFPVYTDAAFFHSGHQSLVRNALNQYFGIQINTDDQRIVRLGYNLFDEIRYLLTTGQDPVNAPIPTLDIHIHLLKKWITGTGIPLIEIPPVPFGYRFIVSLSHDVDFMGIRDHLMDRTMWGFILRALFPVLGKNSQMNSSYKNRIKNIKAVLSLPLVYSGLMKDFWYEFDRYAEIERDLNATYFFIPFKNHPGSVNGKNAPRRRAVKYNLDDHASLIADLKARGNEIGLHGIDAWENEQSAVEEAERIKSATGCDRPGIRMHWLYHDKYTASVLEKAGIVYDSSLGYNNAVGFRAGTAQVFRMSAGKDILELPLLVMDTALFIRNRMGLDPEEGLQQIRELSRRIGLYGGVLTLNWHARSLGPERNWDDFYKSLIDLLRKENVWFARARDAVDWYAMRRKIIFRRISFKKGRVELAVDTPGNKDLPRLKIRHYRPGQGITEVAVEPVPQGKKKVPGEEELANLEIII